METCVPLSTVDGRVRLSCYTLWLTHIQNTNVCHHRTRLQNIISSLPDWAGAKVAITLIPEPQNSPQTMLKWKLKTLFICLLLFLHLIFLIHISPFSLWSFFSCNSSLSCFPLIPRRLIKLYEISHTQPADIKTQTFLHQGTVSGARGQENQRHEEDEEGDVCS